MSFESSNDDTFKEYKPLGPLHRTREHYVVILLHVVAAALIVWYQITIWSTPWFIGLGVMTFVLVIINGFLYAFVENDPWYREEMVPFISRIITTTEIETDRFRQYHRRCAQGIVLAGWIDILICQAALNYMANEIAPYLFIENYTFNIINELVAYVLIFGPFLLYIGILFIFAIIGDIIFRARYSDIAHLLEIEGKWNAENNRRKELEKAEKKENTSSDTQDAIDEIQ